MKTKKTMRGVSEIVVVLALILVAVVAVFAVRGWLTSQLSRLTNVDMATVSYTVSYSLSNRAIVSLHVRNNLQNPLRVLSYSITLSDEKVINPSFVISTHPLIPADVSAKSDATFTITFNVPSGVAIKDVKVLVHDVPSGQQQWITAIGGG